MGRGGRALLVGMGVVVAGVVLALGAFYLGPARAAVGPMPGVALALPPETRVLTGLDVRRFVASPFYQRYGRDRQGQPGAFAELETRTGLNPERDVDQVIMAGQGGGGEQGATVIVTGRFERYKLSRAIESRGRATAKKHEGLTVYLFREGSRRASAIAFLEDDVLVLGSQAEVERTVSAHVQDQPGLKGNAALVALLESVPPGATFWAVGDETLLSQLPQALPGPSGGGGFLGLRGLRSMVVSGELDPALSVQATAQAADESTARQIGDAVRGLIAFASLQAGQKPELQRLASAVTVTTEASRVRLDARLPYDLLDALMPPRHQSGRKPPAGAQ